MIITDDTQLTLSTIEAMVEDEKVQPETVANQFLKLQTTINNLNKKEKWH